MTEPGLTLTDGQTYVVKQGKTIAYSADNRGALVDVDNSATAYGIQFKDGGSATIQGSQIPITAQAWGGTAIGTNALGNAEAEAYGLIAVGGSKITIGGDAVITSQAWGGTATGEGANATANAKAQGLYVTGVSEITVNGDAVITVKATGGTAMGEGTNAYANAAAHGLYAVGYGDSSNSTITVNGNAVISVEVAGGTAMGEGMNAYAYAYGLVAVGDTKITIDGDAVITAKATGGTVTGKQDKSRADSVYAIRSGSSIKLNDAGNRTVQLTGDVEAVREGSISVLLTNADSFLQGNVVTKRTGLDELPGTVTFTVANGAVWRPLYDNRTGSFFDRVEDEYKNVIDSDYQITVNNIDKITLQNGGVVDLGWDTPLRGGSWRTMKINDLTTNDGVIRINSDITNNVGDVFEIANVNAGASLGVQVGYDKASQKGWGTYEGKHKVLTGAAAENIATYGLFYENRAGAYTPIMDGADMVALKIEPSSNIKAAGNAAYSALQLGTVVSNHLDKRLGELRDGSEDGVWARVYGGDLKNSAHGYMKTRYKGIQGGYDQAYSENGGTGRIGGAFSYASGDLELPRGGGDNKAWDFALYKTWQGAKGHYYDLVLHYGKVDTDYHTTDLSRHYSTASYDAHTLGVTAEYGYRKNLRSGWYCQPQAEVSWLRLGSADYTASSGMQVAQDSATSLQGRLGIGVGRKLANGTHYYATLSGVHEFDGKVSLRGDGLGYEQDYGGTWGEFVLGVTAPIDKRWDGYASAERLFGGDMGSTWQLNAGVRLRF
ncbi:MAG: autotransporter outer membrane beta-barrel domain-containing protein [Acidaminococcaceae bacterium]|nr:autotransporter outer membrane beta-barrel domain-containing protein [Acidaminococcaceae bacterium]